MKYIINLFISFIYSLLVMASIHIIVDFVWDKTVNPFLLGWVTCFIFLSLFNHLRGEAKNETN